jgi:hypothetical protein
MSNEAVPSEEAVRMRLRMLVPGSSDIRRFMDTPSQAFVPDAALLEACVDRGYMTKHCIYCFAQVDNPFRLMIVKDRERALAAGADPNFKTIRATRKHIKNAACWRESQGLEALYDVYHLCQSHASAPPLAAPGMTMEELLAPEEALQRKKVMRNDFPPKEVILDWLRCMQNRPVWYEGREEGSGGSGKAKLSGDDRYGDAYSMWLAESGQQPVGDSLTDEGKEDCDHGHHFESEGAKIYSAATGYVGFAVGLFLHWNTPYLHVSPDRMVYAVDSRVLNHYLRNVSSQGISEQKLLKHGVILTKSDKPRPTVSGEKMVQKQDQAQLAGVDWIDISVEWKCRNRDPDIQPRRLAPRTYVVAEYTIVRTQRNNEFAEKLYKLVADWKQCLDTGRLRDEFEDRNMANPYRGFPDVVMLPLLWLQCIMVVPEDQPDEPVDDAGNLTGKLYWIKVKEYYYQKPLRVSMKALRDYSNKSDELDAWPDPQPLPNRSDMTNPLYLSEMRENESYGDMIFRLCKENQQDPFDPHKAAAAMHASKNKATTERATSHNKHQIPITTPSDMAVDSAYDSDDEPLVRPVGQLERLRKAC